MYLIHQEQTNIRSQCNPNQDFNLNRVFSLCLNHLNIYSHAIASSIVNSVCLPIYIGLVFINQQHEFIFLSAVLLSTRSARNAPPFRIQNHYPWYNKEEEIALNSTWSAGIYMVCSKDNILNARQVVGTSIVKSSYL